MLNSSLITHHYLRFTMKTQQRHNFDYFLDHAWIAKTLDPTHDPTVLWNLHQESVITWLFVQLETYYLLMLLDQGHRKAENRELKTEN